MGYGQPISIEKATQMGIHFFNERATNANMPNRTIQMTISDNTYVNAKTWKQGGRNCMYVINNPNGGWVLVSGDERALPILAMSDTGTFPDKEKMPPAMRILIESYADEIIFIQDSVPDAITHPDWQAFDNNSYSVQSRAADNGNGSDLYTPGTCLLNRPNRGEVRWNQQGHADYEWDYALEQPIYNCDYSYNKFCPDWYTPVCGRTYVGCTAVAIAQIMWYWQWPHTGYIHSGIDKKGNGTGTMELHLYDWDLMPAFLTDGSYARQPTPMEQVNMVAGFLRDCGYAVKMKYGEDGSASTQPKAKDALINTFAYSADISYKIRMLTANWDKKIRDEINAGRPVLYRGQRNNKGHEFVIDGYDAANPDKFHVNWGYGGGYNLYCTFADLGYTNSKGENIKYDNFQTALFGIRPAPSCNAITVNNQNIGSGGVYRIGTGGTVTVSNSTIGNGGTGVFYSGTSITLRPGFQATAGSRVHVAIQHFPCDGIAPQSVRSAVRQEEASGIETVDEGLRLYPNPTDGMLTVQSPKPLARIEVYGLGGERLLESRDTILDLHALPDGMYIVMLHFADGTRHSEKVVKQL